MSELIALSFLGLNKLSRMQSLAFWFVSLGSDPFWNRNRTYLINSWIQSLNSPFCKINIEAKASDNRILKNIYFFTNSKYSLIFIIIYHHYLLTMNFDFIFKNGETWHPNIEPKLAHLVHVVLLTFSLHLIDRQVIYHEFILNFYLQSPKT